VGYYTRQPTETRRSTVGGPSYGASSAINCGWPLHGATNRGTARLVSGDTQMERVSATNFRGLLRWKWRARERLTRRRAFAALLPCARQGQRGSRRTAWLQLRDLGIQSTTRIRWLRGVYGRGPRGRPPPERNVTLSHE